MSKRWTLSALIAIFVFLLCLETACSGSEDLVPVGEVPIPATNKPTPEKIELGKKLFFDRRLSGDGTMSCATCHIAEMGFSDGQALSLSYPTTKSWRNTQTLINIAYARALFHDGRVGSLEEQAGHPVLSPFEMNRNLDYVEEVLRSVPEYVEAFNEVFGSDDITKERMALALAAFQRTLLSRNSPLDRYLGGDEQALSPDARRGLEIFRGKGRCMTCHHGVNLSDDRFYALNVPENPMFLNDPLVAATRRFVAKINGYKEFRTLDVDPGRYLVTKKKDDWRAFRTPTLRDISRHGPYMHNGIYGTLEEVIEFFDRGGGEKNKVLKPLGLTDDEKRQLKAFMSQGLTGDEIVLSVPKIP
ncbi:MAG: cytochrome c peroxidase [bacterium]|nr:cytochrome c peroxidase [bacterium]